MKKCILLISPRVFLDKVLYVQTTYQNQNNLVHWKHNSIFFPAFNTEKVFAWNKLHCLIRSLTHTNFSRQNMVFKMCTGRNPHQLCYFYSLKLISDCPFCTWWRSVKTMSVDISQQAYSVAHSTLHHKTGGFMTAWYVSSVRNWSLFMCAQFFEPLFVYWWSFCSIIQFYLQCCSDIAAEENCTCSISIYCAQNSDSPLTLHATHNAHGTFWTMSLRTMYL